MTIYRRESGYYGWERKHPALPSGRISVSLRTKERKEASRRARALDLLVDRGEIDVLQRLRRGEVHVAEVVNAVRDESVDGLRGSVELDLSLGAMIERALATKEATRSESTHRHYRKVTKAMLARWPAGRLITDISTDEMRAWLYEPKGKRRRPWAANTQGGAVMVAGYIWRLAIELEAEAAERYGIKPRITRDPWARIEVSNRSAPRKSFLEPPEWRNVIDHARGRPEAALLALCCLAGLRIAEALNLRSGIDVDLDAGLIKVQGRDGEFAWTPKNKNSERDVPVVPALRAILEDHIRREYAGPRFFIRAARWDKPLSYTEARKWVRFALERAGLKYGRDGELTAHSLRHTFASWLIREGWSATLVARLMGNTSKEVERTYAHLFPSDLHRVAMTIDSIVRETK